MKNRIPYIVKILIAAVLAFVVLNVLSLVYYNVPNRIDNLEETTDYKWEPNSSYSKLTEGLVLFNKVNNEGFHNVDDYNNEDKIDILVMGSSHAEGFNVNDSETFSEVLKDLSGLKVYNIGISDHSLGNCVQNLENALDRYKPSIVVIEIMNIGMNPYVINSILNDNFPKSTSFNDSILKVVQNLKFLRLAYLQYKNTMRNNNADSVIQNVNTEESMNKLMKYIKTICEKHSTQCVILYHPTLTVDNNRNITTNTNDEDLSIIKDACLKSGIKFVNMEEDFINYYKENNTLPHGFNNTIPGQGHLNKYGHMLIAERIKKEIEGNE